MIKFLKVLLVLKATCCAIRITIFFWMQFGEDKFDCPFIELNQQQLEGACPMFESLPVTCQVLTAPSSWYIIS